MTDDDTKMAKNEIAVALSTVGANLERDFIESTIGTLGVVLVPPSLKRYRMKVRPQSNIRS